MIERSLGDRLHYAILSILKSYPDCEHQDYWAAWDTAVAKKMHGCVFTHDDLRWAFEALMQHEAVELTKPDAHRKHATKYEMRDGLGVDRRTFFLNGPFNVKITRSGEKYWEQLGKRVIHVPAVSSDAVTRKCRKCGYVGFVGEQCPKCHIELTEAYAP